MSDQEIPVYTGFEKSPTIGELTKALANARAYFKPVLKDATNPFFKSKYADLAGVIEATTAALSKNELVVIQSPGKIYNGHILLTTLLAHSSGEWIKDELELPIAKFDAQGTGSAITYARRYAYQAIVGVVAEDDDGNAASQKFEKQPDGGFVRKTDNGTNSVPQSPVSVVGKLPEPPKVAARKKKESVPDAGEPWAGLAGKPVQETPVSPTNGQTSPVNIPQTEPNIHGIVIQDSEVPFPGDPEPTPEPNRLPTDEEAKGFRERLIKIKDKGFAGLGQWILKTSGKPRTQDIPYTQIARMVGQVEAADKAGNLKELLEGLLAR
jgi:hypothetical protein